VSDFSLPMLMYHGIHTHQASDGHYEPIYSITPPEFSAQLDWLVAHGYRSSRLYDLERITGNENRVIITFDDGDVSNIEVALPLLLEREMVAEFFITSDFIGRPGMLTMADVRALSDAGMGVQSHGRTHRFLEDLSPAELDDELTLSKKALEEATGKVVDAIALPGGRGGERERLAAQRLGYRHFLNSEPGPNRGLRKDRYFQRVAATNGLALDDFAALVTWSGVRPRVALARYHALALPKRLLGNRRYERWRARVLGQ
jgi:peptidoglycan/xylan/chitin deacetylase (PgdA/CDA1 family)